LVFMRHLIWNLLSAIKNGLLARKKVIIFPSTLLCNQVLTVLYKEGYISGFRLLPDNSRFIEIFLKYNFGKPVVSKILSVSKPSKRVYISVLDLWKFNTCLHTLILSTSKGILSDKESRKLSIGGELLYIIH
jgi:small subunit ribosomal protein S8